MKYTALFFLLFGGVTQTIAKENNIAFSPRIEIGQSSYTLNLESDSYFDSDSLQFSYQDVTLGIAWFNAPYHSFDIYYRTPFQSKDRDSEQKGDLNREEYGFTYSYKFPSSKDSFLKNIGLFLGYRMAYTDIDAINNETDNEHVHTKFDTQGVALGINYGRVIGNLNKHIFNLIGGVNYQYGKLNTNYIKVDSGETTVNGGGDTYSLGGTLKVQYNYIVNNNFDVMLTLDGYYFKFDKIEEDSSEQNNDLYIDESLASIRIGLRYTF